jgi:hypothetical protein
MKNEFYSTCKYGTVRGVKFDYLIAKEHKTGGFDQAQLIKGFKLAFDNCNLKVLHWFLSGKIISIDDVGPNYTLEELERKYCVEKGHTLEEFEREFYGVDRYYIYDGESLERKCSLGPKFAAKLD